jgi:hypothetical protein
VFPPYVVAAMSRRLTPILFGEDARKSRSDSFLPLGVRHAVPSGDDPTVGPKEALCGTSVAGWFMFLTLEFSGSSPADCRRCEQVLRSRRGNGIAASEKPG